MTSRESPYPQVGFVQTEPYVEPKHSYQMKPTPQYAPPPQAPQQQHYQQQPPQQQQYQQQQQQQQQQQWAPQPNNGAGGWPQQQFSGDYGSKVEKLDTMKPKWNDLWCAVLFLAQFGAFVAISVISLRALGASDGGGGLGQTGTSLTLNASTAYLLAIIAGTGLILSIGMLALVKAFTTIILEIALLLSVLFSAAYAAYLWYVGYWSGAIIFTLFAVFAVISYFPMRKRIPLSKQLLLLVLRIAKAYPSVYGIALAGALLQTVYSIYWSFTTVAIYQKWSPSAEGADTSGGTASSGALIGLMIFAVFSFYFTSQFIINWFLVTEAGIFATYYFEGPTGKPVAWGAFKRASTYSMGSIAFGSLIVALLDLLRAGLRVLQQYAASEGSTIGTAIACCAQCCVGCVASLVEYFNRYAMIEIAMYGKPYIQASKDTWRLFKDRGIDALVNDCLVNNVWTWLSYAVGALCSAFAFIYLKVTDPSYIQENSNLQAVMMLYAFLIGFFISHTLGYSALSSGVSTIFVGLAEDPEALAERDPALFELIRRAYPKVTTSV